MFILGFDRKNGTVYSFFPSEKKIPEGNTKLLHNKTIEGRSPVVDVINFFWRKSGKSRFPLKQKQQE